MDIALEDIDKLRQRTGVGYGEAKDVLEKCNGDLLEALVFMEENKERPFHKLSRSAKSTLGRLHQTKVKVKVKDKTMLELPVTVGALSVALFPKLAALGLVGLFFSNGKLEIKENHSGEKSEDRSGENKAHPKREC